MDRELLAKAWIALQHSKREQLETDPNFWALEKLWDLTRKEPELCWAAILAIVDADSSDHILSNIGAGPLEDLLVAHGKLLIDRVEEQAKKQPSFRRALYGVWQNDMPDDIWARVQAAAGELASSQRRS